VIFPDDVFGRDFLSSTIFGTMKSSRCFMQCALISESGQLRSLFEHDERLDRLAEQIVGNADHRGLNDVWKLVQDALHFARAYLFRPGF